MNTYGIRSVNRKTFNTRHQENITFPRPLRNVAITALRITNAVLNVLGYIRGIQGLSFISGCTRMVIGAGIIGVTLAIGERDTKVGNIVGRWYDEAIGTGIAQIARGALEALVPYGWSVNVILDMIATPTNLSKEFGVSMVCEGCMRIESDHVRPHNDVNYPFPFMLLHLV